MQFNPLIPILAPILSVELLTNSFGNESVARVAYIVLMTGITTAVALASWHLYGSTSSRSSDSPRWAVVKG